MYREKVLEANDFAHIRVRLDGELRVNIFNTRLSFFVFKQCALQTSAKLINQSKILYSSDSCSGSGIRTKYTPFLGVGLRFTSSLVVEENNNIDIVENEAINSSHLFVSDDCSNRPIVNIMQKVTSYVSNENIELPSLK